MKRCGAANYCSIKRKDVGFGKISLKRISALMLDILQRCPGAGQSADVIRMHDDYPNVSTALAFCLEWPDLLTAAQVIETRAYELNGDNYGLLTPAAEALRVRHPLAALLLWRAMIDYALEQGRATRYGNAADYLSDCAALDSEITDYGAFLTHAHYLHTLQTRHDRKTSFWAKLG
ncbi:MAG: hypothetical protein ACJAUW_002160 [Yoonia sp.]|jgi:hypothetical protein